MARDAVDVIKEQWQQQKPDLPLAAMETLGRLKRCSVLYQPLLDQAFAKFELSSWEFDVLATLRRSGQPYMLSPTELFSKLMVTSGTMTHRLKTLEAKNWISRESDSEDARQKHVKLTPTGEALIDKAMIAHVDNLESILAPLDEDTRQTLNESLKTVLAVFEQLHAKDPTLKGRLSNKTHGV
jgi:DNA-binding MarR family transcriptional regulator